MSIANGLLVIRASSVPCSPAEHRPAEVRARFTPLYGAAEIARYPSPQVRPLFWVGEDWFVTEPLWYAVVSLVVWAAIFLGVSALLMRRATRR